MDRAGFQLQSFHIVTTTGYAFLPAMNKSMHFVTAQMRLVKHITVTTAEAESPFSNCAHVYCLVSINGHKALLIVNRFSFFA